MTDYVILEDVSDTIYLPGDLKRTPYDLVGATSIVQMSLSGTPIRQYSARTGGLSVAVSGGKFAWIDYATIQQVIGMAERNDAITINFPDDLELNVWFDHEKGAVDATPKPRPGGESYVVPVVGTSFFYLTMNFITRD